ncbi:hypothetical protein F4821DRAFT_193495 [Hypoxylon rubiginosum]|uniref:Uncharacterized protein n=1 Tax=Hypoxylon rubiginosum TaxID=110542 RepID=A0ACC0CSA8_9PEZI|nr:hypothetical protein F4821DRAFT_193495 [Hypoxylon rubiginosum]
MYFQGVKLAMCKQSICDFRAPWKDHRQTDQQRQTHDTREFSRVIPTQQGEFQEVTTRGNANHVGNNFKVIYNYSNPINIDPPVGFGVIHGYSTPILPSAHAQHPYSQATPTGHILGLIMIMGILFTFRRSGKEI